MTNISSFSGLEGMLAFHEGKIGVLNNQHQFIAYRTFNSSFSDQIDKFSREYQQSPENYRLGIFNSESYDHLDRIEWKIPNLILTDKVFKRIQAIEKKLPAEIKAMNKYPVEKCMSSYMGMRILSIFGNKMRCYPVLFVEEGKHIVINFNTVVADPDFEKELKFHKYFAYHFTGTFLDLTTAIVCAVILQNVWALILGYIAGNLGQLGAHQRSLSRIGAFAIRSGTAKHGYREGRQNGRNHQRHK